MTEESEGLMADEDREAAIEAGESKPYLDMIQEAEKAFKDYQDKADNIDKLYADLASKANPARDREFAIFWANIQVLAPSIYSRPPVPVCVPRFRDRRPIPRTASEMLERACIVGFEQADIDYVMRMVRDDLAIPARGQAWLRYEKKDGKERVCIEHKHRKDFLHAPARNWKEVPWVAGASYLDQDEMKKRFEKISGDAYKQASYSIRKETTDAGAVERREKAKVWELWHKALNKVVWVTEGVEVVLDEDAPHLKLEGFFPCPRPAYATVQRGSLIPVPDFVYYKDQIEEINELTARLSALAESVQVRGFYPAGSGEIGDAIEAALNITDNRRIMVPISNWAAFGNGGAKDTIVWLPIDMIVTTIASLVELRKQLINDVYEITGLSDIMRGATEASETATAQQLKSQYGSVRIRDKQSELVRFARDIARIATEIMAENFSAETLLEMSQMEVPKKAEVAAQVKEMMDRANKLAAELEEAKSDPRAQQIVQQNPQAAQQIMQKVQAQIGQLKAQAEKVSKTVTIEQVMGLLREQRIRPFVLDIETDSTIQPDEDAEKQRRAEFMQALGGVMSQLAPLVEAQPQSAGFAGEILKFALAPFRAGRELEGAIDEFIDQMKRQAGHPKPNPEAEAIQAKAAMEKEAHQADMAGKKMDADAKQVDLRTKVELAQIDKRNKAEQQALTLANLREKHQQDMEKGALEIERLKMDILAKSTPEAPAAEDKAPSESINFKDLPPEGQAQMAAQAGINLSPDQIQQHQDEQDAKKAAEAAAKQAVSTASKPRAGK